MKSVIQLIYLMAITSASSLLAAETQPAGSVNEITVEVQENGRADTYVDPVNGKTVTIVPGTSNTIPEGARDVMLSKGAQVKISHTHSGVQTIISFRIDTPIAINTPVRVTNLVRLIKSLTLAAKGTLPVMAVKITGADGSVVNKVLNSDTQIADGSSTTNAAATESILVLMGKGTSTDTSAVNESVISDGFCTDMN